MFISLFILGLVVGFLSALFGVGGGGIIVPVLFSLFPKWPGQTIIASSLLLILFNSLINLRNFSRLGFIPQKKIILPVMAFMVVGVVLGGLSVKTLERKWIELIFGFVVFSSALWMIFGRKKGEEGPFQTHPFRCSMVGLCSGVVTGATGLGGGAVLVPLFLKVLKLPLRQISLYSNSVIPVGALVGALTFSLMKTPSVSTGLLQHFQFGQLNLGIVFPVVLGSLITSPLGVWASQKISKILLRYFFALIMLSVTVKIFWTSFD